MATEAETDVRDGDSQDSDGGLLSGLFYGGVLAVGVGVWLKMVTLEVKGVYLDEEFHVRQALVYFTNQFAVWDPKITTPPGLYLVAYPWLHLLNLLHVPGSLETHLRLLNAVSLLALFWTSWGLADEIRAERKVKAEERPSPKSSPESGANSGPAAAEAESGSSVLVAFNAALFPPLFFFGALFYTDVMSALLVLQAHLAFYRRRPVAVLLFSLASLAFRQTNVFWTSVYLAGLEIRRQLRILYASRKGRSKDETGRSSWAHVTQLSWTDGLIYDPEAAGASFDDYLKSGVSLALAALANIQHLIVPLLPHLLNIGAFVTFVYLNGGVVLGDKMNHVATLHLPQLLYIWPCFVFFSFPLLLTDIITAIVSLIWPLLPASLKPAGLHIESTTSNVPRLLVLGGFTAVALAAIHLNTIVHPFILADNRHYTFYVFRLLMKHPAIKYVAAPIYVVCGWACLTSGAAETAIRREQGRSGARVGVTLMFLVVAAASLITAPLVEPRYFILPWLFWSLNLASSKAALDLQTNWLAIVNLAVGYIFLFWKFEWLQQPGQVMRFMW